MKHADPALAVADPTSAKRALGSKGICTAAHNCLSRSEYQSFEEALILKSPEIKCPSNLKSAQKH